MATLYACGAEAIVPGNGVVSIDNPVIGSLTGTVTRDTSNQQSPGRGCYACDSGAGNAAANLTNWTRGTSGANKSFYWRCYFRFGALPGSTVKIMEHAAGASVSARLTSAGKLQLWDDSAGTQIGSDSAATISSGATYYRVELLAQLNAGNTNWTNFELRLDGTTVASTTGLAIGGTTLTMSMGWLAAPGANKIVYLDDIKVNDSTTAVNNSWPGDGRVILMLPISDNARGNWTAGAGGTTNLWDAVNNLPPAGVADGSATNTSQIKIKSTTLPSSCDLNLDSYTNAGIDAGATVDFVQLFANHGEDPGTGTKAGTVTIVSNPAGAAGGSFNYGDDVGTQGTYIGNWKWVSPASSTTSSVDAPTVTLGTAVVVRITCSSGSTGTRAASCDFLGMTVAYTLAATTRVPRSPGVDSGNAHL